jgi:cyclohexanecarboxylate-CoA ligase
MTTQPIRPTRPIDTVYRDSSWEGRSIATLLDVRLESAPEDLAIVDGAISMTYRELGRAVRAVAQGLSDVGVTVGSSVLVQLPNWWEALVVYHAITSLGAVINPVIPIYRQSEVGFIIEESCPSAIVVPDEFRGFEHRRMIDEILAARPRGDTVHPALVVVRPRRDVPAPWTTFDRLLASPDDADARPRSDPPAESIAMLLYTSGTTAAPKGVLHSHETLVYETRSIQQWFGLGAADHIFMGSPVTHITGFLFAYILPAMTGAAVGLLDVWDVGKAADLIEAMECRFTAAATPFLQGLSDEYGRRGHRSALRCFACGGADVPPDLVRVASRTLGVDVCRVYGSSEFPTYSCGRVGDPIDRRAHTDGFPIGDVAGRLDTVGPDGIGELLVKGPELFHGYLDARLNETSFTDDGYFRTGDLASIDDDGYVTIRGRLKDIIIRNGENISAREVEDLLYTHPDIDDVAVVALPDSRTGERACAAVVSRRADLSLPELQVFLRAAGVATQKWPEELRIVAELPRTASGKVQKFLLRNAFRT